MKNNEIKLVMPQFISMTSSFSHKLVPENHGIEGHRFAPLDFFQSYNTQVSTEEATPERLKEESDKMYRLAKADVENRIAETVKEMRVALETPIGDNALTSEDLVGVAPFVKQLANGLTKDKINNGIVEVKGSLNDRQLVFLRNLIKTL